RPPRSPLFPYTTLFRSRLQRAEVDLHLALVRRDGQRRPGGAVAHEQRRVVEVGEDVAVHHDEVLGQPIEDVQQRTDGRQRTILLRIVDLESPPRTVTGESPNQCS